MRSSFVTLEPEMSTDSTQGAVGTAAHIGRRPLVTVCPLVLTNGTVEEKHVVLAWLGNDDVYSRVTVKLPVNPESVRAAVGTISSWQSGILNGPTKRLRPAAEEALIGPEVSSSCTPSAFVRDSLQLD
jgi:hypothetical protein